MNNQEQAQQKGSLEAQQKESITDALKKQNQMTLDAHSDQAEQLGPVGVRGGQGDIGIQGPTNEHGPDGQQGVQGVDPQVISPSDMHDAINDLRNEIRNLDPRLSTNPVPPMGRYNMDEVTRVKLEKTFTHHPPTPDQIPRYSEIRHVGHELALLLSRMCPPSDELGIAIDCLSAAIMWGNAAIARNE